MAIQVAESNKGKRTKKFVHKLEIERELPGGHIVRHIYAGWGHEPKETKFNSAGMAQGGEHILDHITKYGGIQKRHVKEPTALEDRVSIPTEGKD